MKSRLYTSFSQYKDSDLLQIGNNVVEQMTQNSSKFTDAILAQKDELKLMCHNFQSLLEKSGSRASVSVAEKNGYRPVFIRKLKEIAQTINFNYIGNTPVLEASGFKIMVTPKKHNLTPIRNVILTQSIHKGYVKVRVVGAKYYKILKVYVSKSNNLENAEWQVIDMSKKTFEIGPYEFGARLFIRIEAIGKDNSTTKSIDYTFAVS